MEYGTKVKIDLNKLKPLLQESEHLFDTVVTPNGLIFCEPAESFPRPWLSTKWAFTVYEDTNPAVYIGYNEYAKLHYIVGKPLVDNDHETVAVIALTDEQFSKSVTAL